MLTNIEYILIGILTLCSLLVHNLFYWKLKFFKILRRKRFKGYEDVFNPFQSEWWIAGFTWGFPIIGKSEDRHTEAVRISTNKRLYILYLLLLLFIIIFGFQTYKESSAENEYTSKKEDLIDNPNQKNRFKFNQVDNSRRLVTQSLRA